MTLSLGESEDLVGCDTMSLASHRILWAMKLCHWMSQRILWFVTLSLGESEFLGACNTVTGRV